MFMQQNYTEEIMKILSSVNLLLSVASFALLVSAKQYVGMSSNP